MKDPLDINFYYDVITDVGPVPNGLPTYKVDNPKWKALWPGPYYPNDRFHLAVQPICSFYDSMLKNNCSVSLYTGKDFCSNLFYPVELSHTGINIVIPDPALVNLRKGKLKLLLLAQQSRGYRNLLLVKRMSMMFQELGVHPNNIVIVTGDINNSYKEMFSPCKTYSIDWWQIESKLIINNQTTKYDFFLDNELAGNVLPVNEYNIDNFNPKLLFHTYSKFKTRHELLLIEKLKSHNLYNKGTVISDNDNMQYHTNSLFTILTPIFSPTKDSLYISEINAVFTEFDIWQLIAMGKPFIVIGCQQTISYLNKQGFFTFYNIINEQYDSYLDLDIRIDLICKELYRVYNSDIDLEMIKQYAALNKVKFLSRSHMPYFLKLFDEIRYG